MKLSERCNYDKATSKVTVRKEHADTSDTFQYRWIKLNEPADLEQKPKWLEGRFDEPIRVQQNSVLEFNGDKRGDVYTPDNLHQELYLRCILKKDYTEISVDEKSKVGGIHPTHFWLRDRGHNKLLLGNSIGTGSTWYLPEGVELGHRPGNWHIETDIYCRDVLDISYEVK